VSFIRRSPAPRWPGQLLATIAAAAVLLLSLTLPVGAVQGPTKLYSPSVSPASGTTATRITFKVGYRNREGSGPAYVRVVIDGVARGMTGSGSKDWKHGVLYQYSTTLSAGTHKFLFTASDTRRFIDTTAAGTVSISRPAATPKPTPKPAATPAPTPKPASTPDPTPTPTPAASPSSSEFAQGSPIASDDAGGLGGSADPGTESAPSDEPSVLPSDLAGGPDAGGSPDGMNANNGSDGALEAPAAGLGGGALMTALAALGLDNGASHLGLLPTLVGTSGAVAMGMAFALFGKKRRDEEQPAPDEVLKAKSARGPGVAASAGLVGARPFNAPLEGEAAMPRWRRPSLLEARKADPSRSVSTSQRLAITDRGANEEGRERRVIRYRVVRLLDAPDELRSADLGQLDQGDEVQLLERSGAYWLVLCPDGRRGWLHKMTLGEIVDDAAALTIAEAWGSPEPPGDILQSMLEARGRALT
jgi:hypothetical protein